METVLNVRLNEIHFQFAFLHLEGFSSLVPRPSTPLVFDHFLVCKNGGRPWEFHHVIRSTADVTDSRHNSLFTFVVTVTEKLENRNKFQRRGKSLPVKHILVRSLTAEGWL